MKHLLLLALSLACASPLFANELAVLSIRLPDDKQPKRVVIELADAEAPLTARNFEDLARHGFYNGMAFHRAFKDTLVQAGDPYSKGKDRLRVGIGGPGYTLPPEIHRKHTLGAVATSRLPDDINPSRRSNGSQFYICLKPMPELDGKYTVFGRVLEGMETLRAVSNLPVDTNDNPMDRAIIKSVRIMPGGSL